MYEEKAEGVKSEPVKHAQSKGSVRYEGIIGV